MEADVFVALVLVRGHHRRRRRLRHLRRQRRRRLLLRRRQRGAVVVGADRRGAVVVDARRQFDDTLLGDGAALELLTVEDGPRALAQPAHHHHVLRPSPSFITQLGN